MEAAAAAAVTKYCSLHSVELAEGREGKGLTIRAAGASIYDP